MKNLLLLLMLSMPITLFAQTPPIEPGVSQELARWRAARYSDVRYKLNLTLEKMSPVLKGTIEIRVKVGAGTLLSPSTRSVETPSIILDWRKIKGHEAKSTISNVTLNGTALSLSPSLTVGLAQRDAEARASARAISGVKYEERDEHLIFRDGVVAGENVIKLDFTSPILTSGSAITRYVDKEDGSEYLYSLFVPSDASTAFPVFDQPDLKAKFTLNMTTPDDWRVISNTHHNEQPIGAPPEFTKTPSGKRTYDFAETEPISTYIFAFAAGPWGQFTDMEKEYGRVAKNEFPVETHLYVRKSQYVKAGKHASEVFRLTREGIKYLETYFDYKFPWPKYDIVLIPEFPFGGMEHAGATFLRDASIIFPQEPTKNDHISRATLIFHEAAHQWFGDTVTMRWFDDLWLKEGFATFMAYKAMEKIMPEMNAWKVFYERVKQAAYQTDSTKGTTAIYQPIANLSAAKSAYGNIVYNKAPAFLRQAEFYLGEDKFQTAVRAFLKKHEFGNAGWEDLVREFEESVNKGLRAWAGQWVTQRGLPLFRAKQAKVGNKVDVSVQPEDIFKEGRVWSLKTMSLIRDPNGLELSEAIAFRSSNGIMFDWYVPLEYSHGDTPFQFAFPNYRDYGYGIFLLDEKSRDYVLKNIQNEADPFLRSMMWGALWDSVREGELDPREYVELVVKVQSASFSSYPNTVRDKSRTLSEDESTIALLLSRVGTAMNYYIDEAGTQAPSPASAQVAETSATRISQRPVDAVQAGSLRSRVEDMLIAGMRNAPTLGQRITYYRALLNNASSEDARSVLKEMLKGGNLSGSEGALRPTDQHGTLPTGRVSATAAIPIKTKDKFDIVTRLLILNDPEAPKLLAELEKTETSDDAKRYAYAAKAGIATAENKAKYWNDFVNNKEISESWIEAAFGPWNSIRHERLTLPYLQRALQELPNHKRNRKIFFVNGWLAAFIGGQRSEQALAIVNKFLADNPKLDNDLRLKILENADVIERAVRIRAK